MGKMRIICFYIVLWLLKCGPLFFFFVWYPLGYTSTGYGSASLMTRGFGRHPNAAIWKIVPHCLIWYIWQERNARNFEGCEWSIIELKSFFLFSLLDSDRALQAFSCDSFSDLLVRAIFVEMLMCIPGSFADLIKIVIKKKSLVKNLIG